MLSENEDNMQSIDKLLDKMASKDLKIQDQLNIIKTLNNQL